MGKRTLRSRTVNAIKATWKNGHIVPDEKVDGPEGLRLLIEPAWQSESIGVREEDGSKKGARA
jgi:hypothetical protein